MKVITRHRARWWGSAAGLAAVVLASQASGSAGAVAAGRTVLADYTTPQEAVFIVPAGIRHITILVKGASGGNVSLDGSLIGRGGAGGEAKGKFKVVPGERLQIWVGGVGGEATSSTAGAAGSNGGGPGGPGDATRGTLGGGGGGGGSDVRIGGVGNTCTSFGDCVFSDRIIAAGGGGGASDATAGGSGGGVQGGSAAGTNGQEGGTQDFGGAGNMSGSFGQGADATSLGTGAGGGGAGWYGGGAVYGDGGGGGSGYISPFALSGSFPTATNYGDGEVLITM